MTQKEWLLLEFKGQRISAVLHLPSSVIATVPAVAIFHGFGGNKVGKHRIYYTIAEQLAAAGIAALRIDFRGSGDSDGDFTDMTLNGEVEDALFALDFLDKHHAIDSGRIGILGRSLGGAIAVLAASQYGRCKSLALWAPVFHTKPWKSLWEKHLELAAAHYQKGHPIYFQGETTNLKFVQQFFAMDLADEIQNLFKVPLFHIHGGKDTIIDIEHADQYRHYREDAKAASEFLLLEKSDHDFSEPNDQMKLLQTTLEWFKKTL